MTTTMTKTATKVCGTCKQVLPTSSFYRMSRRGRVELQASCKSCQKASAQRRHAARRPEALAKMRDYYIADSMARPEVWKAKSDHAHRTRRARMKATDCREVSQKDWARLVARYRGLCAYCLTRPWTDQDHVIPLVRGGRHAIGNLLPACGTCNRSKGVRLLVEWRAAA